MAFTSHSEREAARLLTGGGVLHPVCAISAEVAKPKNTREVKGLLTLHAFASLVGVVAKRGRGSDDERDNLVPENVGPSRLGSLVAGVGSLAVPEECSHRGPNERPKRDPSEVFLKKGI